MILQDLHKLLDMSSSFHPGASDHDSSEEEQFDMDMPPASVPEHTSCSKCLEMKSQLRAMQKMRCKHYEIIIDLREKVRNLQHDSKQMDLVSSLSSVICKFIYRSILQSPYLLLNSYMAICVGYLCDSNL